VLEGLVARQAAERATDADRQILKDLTAKMKAGERASALGAARAA
jgi:DNA-binding FadR family transcriptional regulator